MGARVDVGRSQICRVAVDGVDVMLKEIGGGGCGWSH